MSPFEHIEGRRLADQQRRLVKIDAADMLETLEDVTQSHYRLIQSLRSTLVRVKRDMADVEMQRSLLAGLRRLRVLRKRVASHFGGFIDEEVDVELEGAKEVVENVATLSEYMLIVAIPAEEEVLRRTLLLAKRGAELLEKHRLDIEQDIEQLKRLSRLLEAIVDKYYE